MTGWTPLDRLLEVDPRDAGCAHAMKVLAAYAELEATEGRDAASVAHPAVAAHLRACGPCRDDLDGLLSLLREPPTEET
ncbi:MAG: hypothetical protein ACTHMS_05185 [Jatrophihabitans sp.]|uniref:hypothetical protein n=1 Tax=Jatrophihabitans sp. TaxID=1932789 RepID=UPI003F7F8BCF